MMRWIFEHERYNKDYLENANKAAAAERREPTWSSATYMVKIEEGRPTSFLRASELGLGSEHQFVIAQGEQLVAVTPEDKSAPLRGDLFAEVAKGEIHAKTSLLLLRDRAYEKELSEYARLSGIEVRLIEEVSREFTNHGRRAAADFYRGPCQHSNGYYNSLAIVLLNSLIGNVDWKGGMSKGGGHWHEFGGKAGNVYHFKKLFNRKLTSFGVTNTRAGRKYEDTTLFAKDGYPAKRPWYPYIGGMYSEVLPSAADKYPYPLKVMFTNKGTLAFSTPAGTQESIDTLRDPSVIPLFVSFDIVIGETSMYADYIVPDLTYLERWGTPHVTPDIQTKTSKVRQPAGVSLTETVTVDGEEMPISTEAFLIAAAKEMGLPGVGKDGLGPGMNFHRPEDFYLKSIANIAFGDKKGEAVPGASPQEIELFSKARRHLPRSVFDEEKWRRALRPGEWEKVVYVLNRGGRYEDFDKYEKSGRLLPHKFGKMVNFFIEEIAGAKNSMTGKHFDGLPHYEPPMDAKGNVISDPGFPLRLITYKEIFGGHSRTIGNYWTNYSLQTSNKVLINKRDGARLGLRDNDRVRLTSKTNPKGEVDLRDGTKTKVEGEIKLIEGIRPGVVAVSWHYGQWNAYGASEKIVVDGTRINPDPRRAVGLCSNPVNRVDESVGRAGLTDPLGGSVSFYDTDVKLVRV
jgi:anaerobic selenocysteine-containing dehydrogenase